MTEQRYALISVSDKTGIIELAGALVKHGIKLISTGGTYCVLQEAGLPVETVESITGFPEMLDGRVKTLHPKIHAGLLGIRNNGEHRNAMQEHHIVPIDYVVVNLYPFKETIEQKNCSYIEAIENIDIGGPSMLRSAAKNHESVTVVTDPKDYAHLIEQLEENSSTTWAFRRYLAKKVFELTAHYDCLIAQYFSQQQEYSEFEGYDWAHRTLTYVDKTVLRYGENSHQKAYLYQDVFSASYALTQAEQLHGKALSYNNYRDGDAAIKIAREFQEPVAVAVKHMNPCGVAIGDTIEEAFDRCYQADPISIFGGIVVLNRPVTLQVAKKLHQIFLELIIAPHFSDEAFELLSQKKNIRLMTLSFEEKEDSYEDEWVSINGGILQQSADIASELKDFGEKQWEVMTKRAPTKEEIHALKMTMKVCQYVKSNAIVIGNSVMTLGIGAGQMNRVGSAKIALEQAKAILSSTCSDEVFVMASDAFFPMDDTVTLAAKAGITAIIQPGGSIKDQDSVKVCDDYSIAMVKTGVRHFKH